MTKQLNELKFVVIGGGTGSYTVLKGLKHYFKDISAIVTMFDSGGSSGILRDEFGYLPPGDIRRALLALSAEDSNHIFRELLSYRFEKGSGLSGHSFGNLLITALTDISGNEVEAIKHVSKILNITGKVLPVSRQNSNLVAELEDNTIITGETNIDIPKHDKGFVKIKRLSLQPDAFAYDESIKAIEQADFVIIGPGDLYTSLIPNLITKGISEALNNTKATKIYICNVMSKHSETHKYQASEYLNEISKYSKTQIDYMLVNDKKINNQDVLKRYADELTYPVLIDDENLKNTNTKIIRSDLINESHLIRHDSEKIAKTILKLIIDIL